MKKSKGSLNWAVRSEIRAVLRTVLVTFRNGRFDWLRMNCKEDDQVEDSEFLFQLCCTLNHDLMVVPLDAY